MPSIISAGTTAGSAIALTGDTTGNLAFQTNGTTTAMTIDTSQRVGIGETTPNNTLSIKAPVATTLLTSSTGTNTVYTQHTNSAGSFYVGRDNSAGGIFGVAYGSYLYSEGAYPLISWVNGSERMRINSAGDVLINTTTAGLKLTVDSGITITSTDQSTCRLVLQNTTSPGRTFSLVAGTVGVGNDDFTIYDNTASATRVTLKANGEFIIGTADQGAYNLQCNGTGVWGAGAYVNGSDARIKDDIAPLDSGLDVVAKLNPVTYKYKEDWSKDQSTQTGFIAQELLTALDGKNYIDGVVQQGGQYMSVAYQNIIPILVKAIQEQQAMIETLQAEVAALKGVN